MVIGVPELVLGSVVDPAKPPGDHFGRAIGHVRRGRDVSHAILIDCPSGLYGLVIV